MIKDPYASHVPGPPLETRLPFLTRVPDPDLRALSAALQAICALRASRTPEEAEGHLEALHRAVPVPALRALWGLDPEGFCVALTGLERRLRELAQSVRGDRRYWG